MLTLIGAGCGDDDDDHAGPGETTSELSGTVQVFAAASLTDAFTEIGDAFIEANPDVTVEFNFAASSALATQIQEGAPVDVFASADENNMQKVVDTGEVTADPEIFVTNTLEIAVPAGNPGGVDDLDDFANPDLLIGLCAEEVPCGRFGREVLANAGVTPSIDTNEPDVRSLLTKVEAGELDAGIVYQTDVQSAGHTVEGIEIPTDVNVVATYPIAPIAVTENHEAAEAFIEFLQSGEGQEILASYGFLQP
ncbi:MAG: molybdate ABC transporter substrate-binding protein [Acidimicrobiales bacterium]